MSNPSKILSFLESMQSLLTEAEGRLFRAFYIEGRDRSAVTSELGISQASFNTLNQSVLRKLRGA
ncbi:MAG: hypothetical protein BroJett038_24230 [Chloroflexota bacterium]|jgi:DNA-directed RNA polymerase specialized sigma subunit|nr:MAG: hypothetical protein BroJett038_24230 [Chloroflexota bacterium]